MSVYYCYLQCFYHRSLLCSFAPNIKVTYFTSFSHIHAVIRICNDTVLGFLILIDNFICCGCIYEKIFCLRPFLLCFLKGFLNLAITQSPFQSWQEAHLFHEFSPITSDLWGRIFCANRVCFSSFRYFSVAVSCRRSVKTK